MLNAGLKAGLTAGCRPPADIEAIRSGPGRTARDIAPIKQRHAQIPGT